MPAPRRIHPVLLALTALLAPLLVALAPPASATTATEARVASTVVSALNAERRANGRANLAVNWRLNVSARQHGLWMQKYNRLTHQFAGERDLGGREDGAGYPWTTCGENIAYTGTYSTAAVIGLQRSMYSERTPYDAHRQNILNRSFREVGVSVVIDVAHHRIWLTVDFGRR